MKKVRVVCLIGLQILVLSDLAQGRNDYVKFFEKCTTEKNTFDCFKRKAVEVLDSAIKDESVYVINDYVSIAKDPNVKNSDEGQENATERSLDQELDSKFHEYLSSRSVQLTIPGDSFEGMLLSEKVSFSI